MNFFFTFFLFMLILFATNSAVTAQSVQKFDSSSVQKAPHTFGTKAEISIGEKNNLKNSSAQVFGAKTEIIQGDKTKENSSANTKEKTFGTKAEAIKKQD